MENLFVYGTLKPGEINYPYFCADQVIKATRAYTRGRLYDLPLGYPAMTPGTERVDGFLLVLANHNSLEILDQLEDYHPDKQPQDNEYYRQKTLVYRSGEPIGEAWGYFMAAEKIEQLGGVWLPSGWWTGRETVTGS